MKRLSSLLGLTIAAAVPASAAEEVVLRIRVENVKAEEGGSVRCAVFDESGAKGFPSTPEKGVDRAVFRAQAGENRTQLEVPGPGAYAVSCTHDANDNEKLDTNFLGIPREGWGVSQGARPSMRAPRFDEAKFKVSGPKQSVVIRIGY